MTIRLSTNARNAATNAIVDLFDAGSGAGTLEIRSGTQPASAEDAAVGTLLATVTLIDPAFGNSSTGAAAIADPAPVTGVAAGTATWFRGKDSTGATVLDGSVGATGSGADLELATTTISIGLTVDITGGGTLTTPAG